ncbi:acetoacetate metabolism regulatory protein AtoC (Ornithine/argininedecarboxylase inhibitor) (Ornithine decarboxylase antizyme) [Sulfurihydrogenibium azorense Az-Fu1]|uniref:Acetoacetate metabolism regulatory protein AtoC (Ornithine/argininedecarboxylase inhibitor) (Ornithine decarboxylase antizyme) n=1 Tax=Sulfurihydrogenibium azorense (strain DSM 15241 / OCM 825 / Az-Fu1) TaxID=204536 RepID=C1DWP8_SULAA|nr:sigma-54 dependent transcriptional regulator [Sulfurihydrogenibium azorense]ACN98291.1 acetoacetate metabolism regulatory protein AtoC (Ornithine/argininedecarboxylase inhibitor) (Ornithine decarboxylase antizyme) [Sulfurihydrogenibium azorense Az-Fu1]
MEDKGYILIVDDEEDILVSFKEILEDEGYKVDISPNPKEAVEMVKQNDYDLIISDLKMPQMTGDQFLKEIRKFNNVASFIVLTAYGTVETAVDCMKHGAFNYISKPIDFNDDRTWSMIKEAIELAKYKKNTFFYKNYLSTLKNSSDIEGIITVNPLMKEILDYLKKIANFDFTVLIYGESGVGKELFAKAIHQLSNRRNKVFLPINCATISKDVMESEFFGVKKGVFTGADTDRPGILELADGGTVFLDEISEMPLDLQAKFLRFLQEKEVRRIGDTVSKKVDVRVIAATNKDLKQLVKEEKFREDLYFRLEGIKIEIPPLRERKEDIPVLAYHFLEEFNKKYQTDIKGFTEEALQLLVNYHWEGNVRQLENVVREACIIALAKKEYIDVSCLPSYISGQDNSKAMIFDYNLAKKLNDQAFTTKYLKNLLAFTKGNISKAAKLANIERQSLQKLLKKYGVDPSEFRKE